MRILAYIALAIILNICFAYSYYLSFSLLDRYDLLQPMTVPVMLRGMLLATLIILSVIFIIFAVLLCGIKLISDLINKLTNK